MTGNDQDVDELVRRAQTGDPAALGALYDRLAGRVYRYALFRVGNRADAEDLMQRTFLKMIEALPGYRRRGIPFEAWLFRLVRNGVIDHLRSRRTHEPLEMAAALQSGEQGPEQAAELMADVEEIERALRSLTPLQQEVLAYRFMAGLTPREIGLIIGKREGSVRALQFRALQAMRDTLNRNVPGREARGTGIAPERGLEP